MTHTKIYRPTAWLGYAPVIALLVVIVAILIPLPAVVIPVATIGGIAMLQIVARWYAGFSIDDNILSQKTMPKLTRIDLSSPVSCRYYLMRFVGRTVDIAGFRVEALSARDTTENNSVFIPRHGWSRAQRREFFSRLYTLIDSDANQIDERTRRRLHVAAS